jgi:cytochrome c biogenesis protein CcmG/thiol:disulfide interchange protein DsbE
VLSFTPTPELAFVDPAKLQPPAPPLVGRSVRDWKLKDVDGKPLPLINDSGAPTVVLVWATWCLPCKAELKALESLIKEPDFSDVRVVTVSIDQDEARLRRFLGSDGNPFPAAHDGRFNAQLGATEVPTTVVIDRRGTIRAMWTGWGDESSVVRLRDALRAARSSE